MRIKRNPFMRLRFSSPAQLDLLLEGLTFEIIDHDVVRAIAAVEEAPSLEALCSKLDPQGAKLDRLKQLVIELIDCKIFVPTDYRHPLQDAAEHWQKRGWLDALVLHLLSRNITYGDFGNKNFVRQRIATVSLREEVKLDRFNATVLREIDLPNDVSSHLFDRELIEIMKARRSGKPWATELAIDLSVLSDILESSNKESRLNRKEIQEDESLDGSAIFDRSSYTALETYVVVNRVKDLPQGVYRYNVVDHKLGLIEEKDYQESLVTMCIGQAKIRGCAAALIIGAHWSRYYARYKHARAYRNLLINTAELAHYYVLAATAAQLSNFITPAFNDNIGEEILHERATSMGPLYMVAIG